MFSLGNQRHTHNLADAYKYCCPKCQRWFHSLRIVNPLNRSKGKCPWCKIHLKIVDGVLMIDKAPVKRAKKVKEPKASGRTTITVVIKVR